VPPVGHRGGQAARGLSGGQPSSVLGGVLVLGPRTTGFGAWGRGPWVLQLGPRTSALGAAYAITGRSASGQARVYIIAYCQSEAFQKTETVTIPKDEYLRLKSIEEDMSDLRSATEILERIKAGTEELIPSNVVDQLLNGDAPLTVWREYRGLSQSELARQSGVNRIQIIDIESGRKTGSVATLKKLAAALLVDIDDLVVGGGGV
jgi:DNA-binding XRE family transcriptional regulator